MINTLQSVPAIGAPFSLAEIESFLTRLDVKLSLEKVEFIATI